MTRTSRAEPRIGNAKQRPRTDAVLRALARLVVRTFYRRVEIVGIDHFPRSGPVIVVANHFNSLVDATVITGLLPRMPRFLGASTLWDYRPLRPILDAAGVVPLYRRQDGRGDQTAMTATFAKAAELLHSGGVLAVFPEGLSHNKPGILPLKTGTARIALEAERDFGPLDLKIVPIALTFEAKNKFRSRTLVEVGPPIAITANQTEAYRSSEKPKHSAAAKELTQQIQESLELLTPGHESWDDARLLGRAVEMLTPTSAGTDPDDALAQAMNRRRQLRQQYRDMRDADPDRAARLRRDLKNYDRMLRSVELTDRQVAHQTTDRTFQRILTKALSFLVVRVPASAVGLVLNWPAYRLLLALSRRKDLDKRSTWSIFGGLIVFPIYWIAVAILAGYLSSGAWGTGLAWVVGLIILVLAPISGRILLSVRDLYFDTVSAMRAWRAFRTPNRFNTVLLKKRKTVMEQLRSLVDPSSRNQRKTADNDGSS